MCFHGGQHFLSLFSLQNHPTQVSYIFIVFSFTLFFSYILQLLVVKCCRLYNVFGPGASHVIYAQFIAQATAFYDENNLVYLEVQVPDLQPGLIISTE